MKKFMSDLIVRKNEVLNNQYSLLILTSPEKLPEMLPGQFAEVRVDNSSTTFLRRPISINFVDYEKNELWLLVQKVGDGTRKMCEE
jgi:dihydroorotate dehydrogenase electron transfer subunit